MDSTSHEPQPPALPATTIRHNGWTGECMATFCEVLAETGIVADACEAAGKSTNTAYALRRRNPFFNAAWQASLGIARERLADTLLARSIEGNVELIYRDGELVGERHVIDNRLGLAILRRLDRLAELPAPGRHQPERANPARQPAVAVRKPVDWELALTALRTGNDEHIAAALAMFEGHETHEAHEPPIPPDDDDDDQGLDLSDRCWFDDDGQCWMTDFPPPAGFTGYESRPYDDADDDEPYVRACTAEEAAILEADRASIRAAERADDEDLRDRWFALLQAERSEADGEQQDQHEAAQLTRDGAHPADNR